ncbi:leucine-rich repeat protein [Clostridium sp. AM27-31LB]|uniref:leucine-rich repeat protein n=3 Tax=Clostridia TaxID=186801 RepID=UPI0015FD8903|nr:leucine-rich repeat protein [Clostridium sp. AM27-31LB]
MKKTKSEIYLLVMGVAMAGGIFYGKETVGAKNFSKNVQVAIGNSEKLSLGNKSNSIKWTVVSGKNNIKIVDKKANQLSISGKNTVLKFADSCKNVDFSFKVPKSIVIGKGIEKITTNSDVPFAVSEEGAAYSGNLKWSDITFENGIVLKYDSVKALLTEGYFGRKLYKAFDKEMKYQNGMYIWGEKYLTDYDGKEASLEIPDGITEINAGAFAQCTQMPEKITIPDSVFKIEKYTFNNQNTGRLKEIVMSDKTIADKDAIEPDVMKKRMYCFWTSLQMVWMIILLKIFGI